MPTLANMLIPPPIAWNEFESITLSALKLRWRSANLQQNGRQGQSQHGVDIYGSDDLGRQTGVQCKVATEVTSVMVVDEIAKAERFAPQLAAFFIATTGKRDAKIQAEVRVLSEARLVSGKFPVGILFWEDIIQDLVSNPSDLKKHYPQLDVAPRTASGFQPLCALDLAYWGFGINQSMGLIFGRLGQMVAEDPYQIDNLLRTVDACVQVFVGSDHDAVDFCRKLPDECHKAHTDGAWDNANNMATQLEGIVEAVEYKLRGRALAAYTIGKVLRRWDIRVVDGKLPSQTLLDDLLHPVRTLTSDNRVENEVKAIVQSTNDHYLLPPQAYGCVRRHLLREGMDSSDD